VLKNLTHLNLVKNKVSTLPEEILNMKKLSVLLINVSNLSDQSEKILSQLRNKKVTVVG